MMDAVIQSERLTRYFGRHCAVDQVSFGVPRGSVTALLGRNGSGKTTLIRMLLGMLEPTRGSGRVLGCDSGALTPEVRGRVGFVAENHPLYEWMSVGQLARHQASFYPNWNDAVFRKVVDHFQLNEKAKASSLSRGQRAGVALALALAPEPELLVLDDPSLGLDPVARRAILEMMLDVSGRGDRTVFLSTHELQDVERIADRVLVLDKSVLVADAEKDYLLGHVREYRVASPPAGLRNVVSSTREGEMYRVLVANPDDEMARQMMEAGAEERAVSLEDAVIGYLGRRGHVLEEAKGGGR